LCTQMIYFTDKIIVWGCKKTNTQPWKIFTCQATKEFGAAKNLMPVN
jgi:hypothetical protein